MISAYHVQHRDAVAVKVGASNKRAYRKKLYIGLAYTCCLSI